MLVGTLSGLMAMSLYESLVQAHGSEFVWKPFWWGLTGFDGVR
jgi:hypothetical protein